MMKVSFCTTCKGRLWQLSRTIHHNLSMLDHDSEIVLLDYHSPDALRSYVFDNFSHLLGNKLKYYRMCDDYAYTSSYAKNVAHRLGDGDILFNLDGDNYITEGLINDLRAIDDNTILIPSLSHCDSGLGGRLGYRSALFNRLGGYDEAIVGMKGDDGAFLHRARRRGIKCKHHLNVIQPIQNTREQKDLYTRDNPEVTLQYPPRYVKWGVADVISWDGQLVRTHNL